MLGIGEMVREKQERPKQTGYITKDWLLGTTLAFIAVIVTSGGAWTINTLTDLKDKVSRIEEKLIAIERRIGEPYTQADAARDFRFRDIRLNSHETRIERLEFRRNNGG